MARVKKRLDDLLVLRELARDIREARGLIVIINLSFLQLWDRRTNKPGMSQ